MFGTTAPHFGAHAEYICLPASAAITAKPASLSYAEAAAVVDSTALVFLRDRAELRGGQTIQINGASGAVGSAAVQLARHYGATVTGVCSGPSVKVVRGLGAEDVIDYTETDFTRAGRAYDVIFDVAGTSSFGRCRAVLNRPGRYLTTAPSAAIFVQMAWTARFGARTAAVAFTGLRPASEKRRDLDYLRGLAEAGSLRPVIDTCYPLPQVAGAYYQVDAGHKKGNVVLLTDH